MPPSADTPWAALLPVLAALDELHVVWHVGGSLASGLHGVFRSTNDVDVVADLRPAHAADLARRLALTHACDEEWIRDAIARHGSFNAIHDASGFKIDVFVGAANAFDRSAMARRIELDVPAAGRSVYAKSAEDIVLQKLRWFRDGGEIAQRQWLDALGVVKLQRASMDLAYVREWADTLGIADLFEALLAEAG